MLPKRGPLWDPLSAKRWERYGGDMMGQEGRWGSADREGETSREVMGSAPRQPGPVLEAALGDQARWLRSRGPFEQC